MVEVVTYANKSFGMFEDLINNDFGVKVKVLGWGTKWHGFSDKSKGLLRYLQNKRDKDIIVFVDGFDTKINKSIENVAKMFKQCECKVLLSRDPQVMGKHITNHIFGTCTSAHVGNAGMFMGYAKELKLMMKDAISMGCKDDQINLNRLCGKYDFIKVDENDLIFKNFGPRERETSTNAVFVSFPGNMNIKRWSRAVPEYAQFFYLHILFVNVLLLAALPKRTKPLLLSLALITVYYIIFADRSCTIKT